MQNRDLTPSVLQALHRWNAPGAETPFQDLLIYQRLRQSSPHERPHRLMLRILGDGLLELEKRDASAAKLLRQRFAEERTRKDLARTLAISISHFDRIQHTAVVKLAEVIQEFEERLQLESYQRAAHSKEQLRHRLDQMTTYDRLFGVDEPLARLSHHLLRSDAPHIFAVEGIGGIGKTSLVIECLRQIIEQAEVGRFAFVTAQQQQLLASGDQRTLSHARITPDAIISDLADQLLRPDEIPSPASTASLVQRMQQALGQDGGLLAVDNLETIEMVDELLPTLHRLAGPAKIVLTTRTQLTIAQPVHRLILSELSQPAALALLRHQVESANVTQLLAADDTTLGRIYDLTGGNPLALRLVVGQCHAHPLDVVLADLLQARGAAVEQLYTFIFHRAWEHLRQPTQHLLVAMLLIPPQGADLALVQRVSAMDEATVHDSLSELVRCNLVSYHPLGVAAGVYSLHSLTRTFLHRQVLRWM